MFFDFLISIFKIVEAIIYLLSRMVSAYGALKGFVTFVKAETKNISKKAKKKSNREKKQ